MPRVTRHLRVGLVLVLLILLASVPLSAGATSAVPLVPADAPKLIITELQTTGKSSGEEFVELYNTTDTDLDLTDMVHNGTAPWKVQFFSAAAAAGGAPDWTKPSASVTLDGTVPAHSYFVLAGTGYAPGGIDSDQTYSPRLSDSGGGVQLVTAGPDVVTYFDRMLWKRGGDPAVPSILATPAVKGSLQRLPNEDSEYVQTDGTLADFTLASDISPKDMWHEPLPPQIPDAPDIPPADMPGDTGPVAEPITPVDNTGLAAPFVTEALPNPATPQTDNNDEFIELYNPNGQTFSLAGYSLEVGTSTLHDFTFADGMVLPPLSYTAFYSRDTNLSMSNSGGQVRLLDPNGTPVDETAAYDAAADGMSWAYDGANWSWSTTGTPNAANTITLPVSPVKPTAEHTAGSKKTTKKPAASAKAKPSVKGTSSTKTKATASKKKSAAKAVKPAASNTADLQNVPAGTPIHTGVLVGVVAAAVLYAGYEYRHDLRNKLRKRRYNRAVRAYARQ